MTRELSAADRLVLDRLQTELARRADGALDFWTLVCLGPAEAMPDPQGFVAKHGEILRSLAVVLRAILASAGQADTEPIRGLLEAIAHSCQEVTASFLVLGQFRTAPLVELRSATQALALAYVRLLAALKSLGEATGCPASYWNGRPPEREMFYRGILDGLFEQFRQARTPGAQLVPV